ncbi:MAG: FAD-dependent oxidoreductase [Terriglobales bacterium]|jgi:ferredoxin-NADP reductase
MAQFQTQAATVIRSTPLSEFTRHLEFQVKGSTHFGFVPGQWISVKANNEEGEEITRAYSIASPPETGRIALCLNRVHDGFMSNHLTSLAEGAEIAFQGPFGNFILHPPMRDTIFIATGTGIAPFRSMLHWLLADPERHQGKKLWLLFGARTEQELYYQDEFKKLAAAHENFHFLPTLSRATPDWHGLQGYVQEHVKEIVGDRNKEEMHAYICGLDNMVKANRELLKSLGWDRASIRYEKYD